MNQFFLICVALIFCLIFTFWMKKSVLKLILVISLISLIYLIKFEPRVLLFAPLICISYYIVRKLAESYNTTDFQQKEKLFILSREVEALELKVSQLKKQRDIDSEKVDMAYELFTIGKAMMETTNVSSFFSLVYDFLNTRFKDIHCAALLSFKDNLPHILVISDRNYEDMLLTFSHDNIGLLTVNPVQVLIDNESTLTSIPLKWDESKSVLLILSDLETSIEMFGYFEHFFSILNLGFRKCVLYEEVEKLATHDGLTGLFLRRYFLQLLELEIKRMARAGGHFSLLMLDIDNFKKVNDTYGHLIGDKVLKQVAVRIKESVRAVDMACRYGGEEFLVCFVNAAKKDAYKYAEIIRKNVEDMVVQVPGLDLKITISGGIANFPYDATSIQEAIEKADKAMYLAKSKGKNCIILCDEA